MNENDEEEAVDHVRNIILVGTKADLCIENAKKPKTNKREVKFSEAVALAKKLNFAGCFEVSSRLNTRTGQNDNFFEALSDVFSLAACLCVDQTTREIAQELSMMGVDGNMTQQFLPGYGGNKLNNTVIYKNQSEENIIFRANRNNDSFYSFALAGHAPKGNAPSTVFDGNIQRKSFPRNHYYDTESNTSSAYQFRKGCC